RLPEEREAKAEHDSQDQAEDAVARRLRLNAYRLVGVLDDGGVRRLQRLHRRERLLAVDEIGVEGRPALMRALELMDMRRGARERTLDRCGVERPPVDRVLTRVLVDETACECRIVVRDLERQDVGVR